MKTNEMGLDIIRAFEGCSTKAYRCPANVLTIGYGHTDEAGREVIPTITEDMEITEEKAEEALRWDVRKFERHVDRMIHQPMNENEFSAMVSLIYNIGPGNFSESTVRRRGCL